MGPLRCALFVLLLGLLGVHAAVLSTQKLSHRQPGTPRVNGTAGRLGIYKGKTTSIKKHPYMAAVLYYSDFACAATIISKNWVLLSGDCIYGYEADSLSVLVGSNDASSGKKYAVKEVVTHPNYGITFLDYDVGLLKIKSSFTWSKTVKKAKLPKKEAKADSEATVVGWGETGSNEVSGNSLREGNMEFLSRKKCDSLYKALGLTLTDRMSCTYNKGKVTPCENDWSDPMMHGDTIYQLFVAVGTSGECTSSAYPAINADVYSVVKWIKKTTGLEDEEDDEDEDEDQDEDEEEDEVEE